MTQHGLFDKPPAAEPPAVEPSMEAQSAAFDAAHDAMRKSDTEATRAAFFTEQRRYFAARGYAGRLA